MRDSGCWSSAGLVQLLLLPLLLLLLLVVLVVLMQQFVGWSALVDCSGTQFNEATKKLTVKQAVGHSHHVLLSNLTLHFPIMSLKCIFSVVLNLDLVVADR